MPRNQGTSRKGKPKKAERASGMGRALERATQKRNIPTSHTGGMAALSGVESIDPTTHHPEAERMKSVLEMNDLADFIGQAELSQREFSSERERFVVIDSTSAKYSGPARVGFEEEEEDDGEGAARFEELSLPRRPEWNDDTTPAELDRMEKESFLDWRRSIAAREEELFSSSGNSASVTPFEKNIEVWRQLWRVCERSDLVIQIVDGRDILFYLNEDLRRYVVEELGKWMVVLVNKSDYLTEGQRRVWSDYLTERGWVHFFYSARREQRVLDRDGADDESHDDEQDATDDEDTDDEDNEDDDDDTGDDDNDDHDNDDHDNDDNDNTESKTNSEENITPSPPPRSPAPSADNPIGIHTPLTRTALLTALQSYTTTHLPPSSPHRTYGTVGFPNVGKSSLINTLLGVSNRDHKSHRVAVAAQPGKTKHFQTLALNEAVTLVDCPGLVFPSLVRSRAGLILGGVFPISQMRDLDYRSAVAEVLRRVPLELLRAVYGLGAGAVKEVSSSDGRDVVEEFLTEFCRARSFWAASGNGAPDFQRAGRLLVKDYVAGRLLYCHSPPGLTEEETGWFERETVAKAVMDCEKLRERVLGAGYGLKERGGDEEVEEMGSAADESAGASSVAASLDYDDLDILNVVMGGANDTTTQQQGNKRGKNKANKIVKKKWGKKGRKLRNPDPYGCHTDPDDTLTNPSSVSTTGGLTVKGGKYGKQGYTRPNYAGVKSAVPFESASSGKNRN